MSASMTTTSSAKLGIEIAATFKLNAHGKMSVELPARISKEQAILALNERAYRHSSTIRSYALCLNDLSPSHYRHLFKGLNETGPLTIVGQLVAPSDQGEERSVTEAAFNSKGMGFASMTDAALLMLARAVSVEGKHLPENLLIRTAEAGHVLCHHAACGVSVWQLSDSAMNGPGETSIAGIAVQLDPAREKYLLPVLDSLVLPN